MQLCLRLGKDKCQAENNFQMQRRLLVPFYSNKNYVTWVQMLQFCFISPRNWSLSTCILPYPYHFVYKALKKQEGQPKCCFSECESFLCVCVCFSVNSEALLGLLPWKWFKLGQMWSESDLGNGSECFLSLFFFIIGLIKLGLQSIFCQLSFKWCHLCWKRHLWIEQ